MPVLPLPGQPANVNGYTLDKVLVSSIVLTNVIVSSLTDRLQHLGMSRYSATQALRGQVVTSQTDRAQLAAFLAASLGVDTRAVDTNLPR